MGESAINSVRVRRKRKHPYRRYFLIILTAAFIIGGILLIAILRRTPERDGFNVPGDAASDQIQFK